MAHRVLPDEIKDVLVTALSNTEITIFIDAAHITVDALLDSAVLSAKQLKEIERYLTAHFIASTKERQIKSETVDGAKTDYGQMLGKGLDSTTYGQMAKQLDTSGALSADLGQKSVQFFAITSFEND